MPFIIERTEDEDSELGVLTKDKNRWKYFCGLIYQKLGVSTRVEALNKAAELGDI